MKVFSVGIIGLGSIGLRMLEGFHRHPRFDVGAVWDPSPSACGRARAQYPDLTFVGSADELMGYQGVEDRKSTRLNSSHSQQSRMPSSA